jgi:hypothetical protein
MIPLGYEIGTGTRVSVPLGHLVVTGQTQKSGKTTTLEALITRSQLRAVAFITKRGEKSFRLMTPIAPYFQERADWQFVQALLETSMKTKMDFKQAWIMRAADGASTLEDVRDNIRRFLHGEYEDVVSGKGKKKKTKREWSLKPARGLNADMYYVLDQYFEEVMPQVKQLKGSKTLKLARGVNVMDLSAYTFPMQALVIRSVLEYIYEREHGVIVIIPEAWEFIPEGRRSPVRLAAEELIRKGAAEKNFVWLDSQDIAGVAKVLLRQMEVWIFGVQRDPRELKRTLEAIPDLPRPKATDVAMLGKGQFVVAFGQEIHKVYVQPAGMEDAHAQAIARGEERPESWTQIVRSLDREESLSADRSSASESNGSGDSVLHADDDGAANVHGASQGSSGLETDVSTTAEDGEPMWKEKYDEFVKALSQSLGCDNEADAVVETVGILKTAHDALAKRVTSQISPPPQKAGEKAAGQPGGSPAASNGDFDAMYRYIVNRAAKEQEPALLSLLMERPELTISVQRKKIEANGSNLRGALGILISEKFFDGAREFGDVRKDLIRRGFLGSKAPNLQISQALQGLVELGFLTKEETGYQAVAGMKINIVEARA